MRKKTIQEDIHKFIDRMERHSPSLKAKVTYGFWTPGQEISPSEPIVRSTLRASKAVLGFTPKLGGYPACNEAAFIIAKEKIPMIPGFGPGILSTAHGPNEKVSIKDVVDATKIFALTTIDFLGIG
jgi:acetylornithine deacetylase/succinyl-diaminopimelate desuccinylase-like protein